MLMTFKRPKPLGGMPAVIASAVLIGLGASPAWALDQPEPPQPVATSTAAVVAANTQFAVDLFSRLRSTQDNILFSPYNLSTAMAGVYEGARGNTAEQIRSVFRLPADAAARRAGFAAIHPQMGANDGGFQLAAANVFWADKRYRFLPTYFDTLRQHYAAHSENVDFQHDPQAARNAINRWVEAHTGKRIKELWPPSPINSLTRLVLTPALFFKGNWAQQFDRKNTALADFYASPTQTLQLPMMSRKGGHFKYLEDDTSQVLEMPYQGGNLSMLWVLPKKDLKALEKSLTAEQMYRWQSTAQIREVDVSIPKFVAVARSEMKDILSGMGMPEVFRSASADLSGMDGTRLLYVSNVFHQVAIEVNEEGSEAAAASAVVVNQRSIRPPPVAFRADRPFLFLIQDNRTKLILFLGRLSKPAGGTAAAM